MADQAEIRTRAAAEGAAVRLAARAGTAPAHTAGLAPGNLQGNLVILPAAQAEDFEAYCRANPAPCPLLGISEPGAVGLPSLGRDIDIRRDLPGYRVWRDGRLAGEVGDVADLWRDDLVSFVIGCSFSFEAALEREGIALRHWREGTNVPMYVTNIQTRPGGPFAGPMVVSMRPIRLADVARAKAITAAAPNAHGAPVQIGDPAAIGIADLAKPDFGEATRVEAGEVPVFWACGVTPQMALQQAKLPLAITHRPGAMLVTDLPLDAPTPERSAA
ncbi:MAG: putative hydro-lyase [Rhodospirillales bacterium]